MNKWITGLFATALVSGTAFADTSAPAPSAKDLSKAVEKVNYVETDVSGVKLSGYVDAGYSYNFIGSSNLFSGVSLPPGVSAVGNHVGTRFGQDGQAGGDFNLNAVKLTVSKDLTNKNEWQAGFRADVMLGEDAGGGLGGNGNGPSANNGSDSFLLEQGYVTFRAPVGNGIDFKVGKFVTWLGYETIERPSNLNITYGNLFQNMIPLYHTGVSAEYKINDSFNTGVAIVNGYNSDSNNGFDTGSDGYGMEAKIGYTNPGGNFCIQDAVYYSWDSAGEVIPSPVAVAGYPSSNGNVVINDITANWTPKFANGKLLLGANADFGYADLATNGAGGLGGSSYLDGSDTWWGAAVYAKYQFTEVFSLAARADYVHDANSSKLYGNYAVAQSSSLLGSSDVWSLTLTAGFNVAENLVLRTEYRIDYGNDIQGTSISSNSSSTPIPSMYISNGQNVAQTVAVEAVYTF